ncbi:hypothetical protein HOY34_12205 [Xinfangfangia sp. D13-10-4-6]|uniref:hypothetical protein n=1 Tax=Pseudogemmobacter hezensis TaxID=2737662 RepID=UPI001552BC18|nr:hypothetical protein [Pseudogemmobacter hezensis]NPD15961.1 hypothetical protein [Pseudogemmobacter hezensis]
MIYNGFDPAILAWISGEDRVVSAQVQEEPITPLEKYVLIGASVLVLLVAAALISGVLG